MDRGVAQLEGHLPSMQKQNPGFDPQYGISQAWRYMSPWNSSIQELEAGES